MTGNVLQVLTYKSVDTILDTGGTQSWALDRARAMKCEFAVCCRNANTRAAEGKEGHGSAFMVGRISDVVPSTETEGRWLVQFSEYALINVGDQWEGRNPVHFYTTDDYDGHIDFDKLKWTPMPDLNSAPAQPSPAHGLTMAEAKAGLAVTFGVEPAAIEITIRG